MAWRKIQEHYEVVKNVLGGVSFVLEAHEDVYRFLQRLFYPCTAIEGGLTLLELLNDWLDLRVVDVKKRDCKYGKVILAYLHVVVAYNSDRISTQTTEYACRLFKEAIDMLRVRFEPYSNNFEFRLSDEEIEQQIKAMNEFKNKVRELFTKVIEIGNSFEKELKTLVDEIRNELCKTSITACNNIKKYRFLRDDKEFLNELINVVKCCEELEKCRDEVWKTIMTLHLKKAIKYFTKTGIEVILKYRDRILKVSTARSINYLAKSLDYYLHCLEYNYSFCKGLMFKVKEVEEIIKSYYSPISP